MINAIREKHSQNLSPIHTSGQSVDDFNIIITILLLLRFIICLMPASSSLLLLLLFAYFSFFIVMIVVTIAWRWLLSIHWASPSRPFGLSSKFWSTFNTVDQTLTESWKIWAYASSYWIWLLAMRWREIRCKSFVDVKFLNILYIFSNVRGV